MKLAFKSMEWSRCPGSRKWLVVLATGFGLGLSPVASGTAGTLLGIPLAFGVAALCGGSVAGQILCAVLLAAMAIGICEAGERHFGGKDDGRIVADEYLTFPIGLIGLPLQPGIVVTAFLTNRVMDILKPFPARGLQRLPGGLGIVVDDAVSACYSLALNYALVYWVGRWL